MSKPIAKQDDLVLGVDTHVILVASPGGPVPTPIPHPFAGPLDEKLSTSVFIDSKAVAVVGSVANGKPPHIPMGGPFQTPPSNKGTVSQGSPSVFIDGAAAARAGDPAKCCNDPAEQETGHIIAVSTVFAE